MILKKIFPSHSARIALLILIALSASLFCNSRRGIVNNDGIAYLYSAQSIAQGDWHEAANYRSMIFYSMLIAGLQKFISDWVLAGQILSMTAMLLAIIPFYFLVYDLWGKKHALISSLFFVLIPHFRESSTFVIRDPFFILFSTLFLWLFLRGYQQNNNKYYLSALVSALCAALFRVEGTLLLAISALIFLWHILRTSQNPWIKRSIMILTLILAIVFVQYYDSFEKISRVRDITKIVYSPTKFYQSFHIHHVRQHLNLMEKAVQVDGHGGILVRTARHYALLLYSIAFIEYVSRAAFHLMFLLGVIGILRQKPWREKNMRCLLLWLLFFAAIPFTFILSKDFLSTRYVAMPALIICCWTSPGFFWLVEQIEKKISFNRQKKILLLLALLIIPAIKILRYRTGSELNIKEAGTWLVKSGYKSPSVVTNDFRILYYAGYRYPANTEPVFENMNFEQAIVKAQKCNARVIAWRTKVKEMDQEKFTFANIFPGKGKHVYVYILPQKTKIPVKYDKRLCLSNEQIIFSFINEKQKILTICQPKSKEYLVCRYGTPDKIEWQFPQKSEGKFSFYHYLRGGGAANAGLDLQYLTFHKDNFRYKIYYEYDAESEKTELGIARKDTKTKEELKIPGLLNSIRGSLLDLKDDKRVHQMD